MGVCEAIALTFTTVKSGTPVRASSIRVVRAARSIHHVDHDSTPPSIDEKKHCVSWIDLRCFAWDPQLWFCDGWLTSDLSVVYLGGSETRVWVDVTLGCQRASRLYHQVWIKGVLEWSHSKFPLVFLDCLFTPLCHLILDNRVFPLNVPRVISSFLNSSYLPMLVHWHHFNMMHFSSSPHCLVCAYSQSGWVWWHLTW